MLRAILITTFISLSLSVSVYNENCANMEYHEGPYVVKNDNEIVENMIIVTRPGEDTAITVNFKENVIIRNVLIYHPASARGISGWSPQNLELYNVEVVAYGNAWGAQPCPSRSPFNGFQCNNIVIWNSPNLKFTNVRVENGSKGIQITNSPGSQLINIEAINMRGPYPSGQCVSMSGGSHDTLLQNFHCYNNIYISWPEDSINAHRSSDVRIMDGVVDGNNALTGCGLQYEQSAEGVSGGLYMNVEVLHTSSCFCSTPADGLFNIGGTCASQICKKRDSPRGHTANNSLQMNAGDNIMDQQFGGTVFVHDFSYFEPCELGDGRLYWERRPGEIFNFLNEWTELDTFTPREPFRNVFPWEECGVTPPDINCHSPEWPVEELGSTAAKINIYTEEELFETMRGDCWPATDEDWKFFPEVPLM